MISHQTATDFTVTMATVAMPTFDQARMQKCVDAFPLLTSPRPVEADKRLTDPVKKAADLAKKSASSVTDMANYNAIAKASGTKMWLDTAFSPLKGGWIFAIALAVGDGPVELFIPLIKGGIDQMLENFLRRLAAITNDEHRGIQTPGVLPSVQRPVIVGHGVESMLRFVWQMCVQRHIKVPVWFPVGVSPFATDRIFDVETVYVGARGKLSLDDLSEHFSIPVLPPIDLVAAYEAGRYFELTDRAIDSVMRIRTAHHLIVGMEPTDSDTILLDREEEVDDEEDDFEPLPGGPQVRHDPEENDAMSGVPIDETDIEDDTEPYHDDQELK